MKVSTSRLATLAAAISATEAATLSHLQPTPLVDDLQLAYEGMSPKPTAPPELELKRRDAISTPFTVYTAADVTCGYISGLAAAPWSCYNAKASCVLYTSSAKGPGRFACCDLTDGCSLQTSCIPYSAYGSCNDLCKNNNYVVKCSNPDYPYCVTGVWPQPNIGAVGYYCDSSSYGVLSISTTYSGQKDTPFHTFVVTPTGTASASGSSQTVINPLLSPSASASATGSNGGSTNGNNGNNNNGNSGNNGSSGNNGNNNNGNSNDDNNKSSTPVGPIVGGVVGGVGAIAIAGAGLFFFLRNKKKKQSEKDAAAAAAAAPPNMYQGSPPPGAGNAQSYYGYDQQSVGKYPGSPASGSYAPTTGSPPPQSYHPSWQGDQSALPSHMSGVSQYQNMTPSSPSAPGGSPSPVHPGGAPVNVAHEVPTTTADQHRGEMHELA